MNNQIPQSDSIMQGCSGDANLDFYAHHQFMQNENVKQVHRVGLQTTYHLSKKKCLKGSFTGTVYIYNQAAFTFCEKGDKVVFTKIPKNLSSPLTPTGGYIGHNDGFIKIYWNNPVLSEETHLVVSYEYEYATEVKKATFPSDNMCTLGQLASDDNLDVWYAHVFVEGEELRNPCRGKIQPYTLEMIPVCRGTVCGKIMFEDLLIQTFTCGSGNDVRLVDVINDKDTPKVVSGTVNLKTGNIKLIWDQSIDPQSSKLIVHYEYDSFEREQYLKCLKF